VKKSVSALVESVAYIVLQRVHRTLEVAEEEAGVALQVYRSAL
jgi:hypothetical protein